MHELDLERELRLALRLDADANPFSVTGSTVREKLAERRAGAARSRRRAWLGLAAAILLAGAVLGAAAVGGLFEGPEATPSTDPTPSLPPPSVASIALDDLRYGCAGWAFPLNLFDEPGDYATVDDPLAAALRTAIDDEFLFGDEWRLVGRDATTAMVLGGRPGDPAWSAIFVLDGRWRLETWNTCDAVLTTPGTSGASWTLDPSGPGPVRTSSSFKALVTEIGCASGQSSEGRVEQPLAVFLPDRIVVGFPIATAEGRRECWPNPATPVAVELGQPIGERPILDGGRLPFREAFRAVIPTGQLGAPSLPEMPPGAVEVRRLDGSADDPPVDVRLELPAGADELLMTIGCAGTGTIEVLIDERLHETVCPVSDHGVRVAPAIGRTADVSIEAKGTLRYSVRLATRSRAATPGIEARPPAGTFERPGVAGSAVPAFTGCEFEFVPAAGPSVVETCRRPFEPLPADWTITTTTIDGLTLALADGWVIAKIVPDYRFHDRVSVGDSTGIYHGIDVEITPSTSVGVPLLVLPDEWAVRVEVTAERGGDRLVATYHARVVVVADQALGEE
jgi:hypothetical protein